MKFLSVCAGFLICSAALADGPTLVIPTEIPAQPGAWVVVSPETTAKAITYVSIDNLSAFPSSELKDPRKLIVSAPMVPGKYRFTAVGSLNDEHTTANFSVVVSGSVPPGPTPPVPPGPESALTKTLRAARDLDPAFQREKTGMLVQCMKQAALNSADPAITTNAVYAATVRKLTDGILGVGVLANTRASIGKHLAALFPADEVALTPDLRAKFRAAYTEIAAALEAL